mgnify:CR=1 FL=1
MSEEITLGWANKVVTDKQWLLHMPTLAIGPAEELFDGKVKMFRATEESAPVTSPVVKLLTGHALVANPNAFIELSFRDVEFYKLATRKFTEFMTGAVQVAAEAGVQPRTAVTILITILKTQLRALETIDHTEGR